MGFKKHVYLAGPLFSRGEIRDRQEDELRLSEELGGWLTIYSPYSYNVEVWNDKSGKKLSFFDQDIKEMEKADIAIVDLDNFDPGTIAELGWFYHKKTPVYAIYSNWKQTEPGQGMNTFIKGLVNNKTYKNINEVIVQLRKDYGWKR